MHPKTRSHNGYFPATESRETTQKLSIGPKAVSYTHLTLPTKLEV